MESRREFIKKASLLASGISFLEMLPPSIQKAMAIDPTIGSTYLDAEHIVILMQENRSFDHAYGNLQGVRGFNDPRAISLPNKNKVWLQTNDKGETYAPFHLNIKDTSATWMSSLPHSWEDQVHARNDGKYDKWLQEKESGHIEFKKMPLTMGYYNRKDIPFYYALADAFTICDQNFCSSLTGTTPNRLYLWSGTIKKDKNESSKANVLNSDADYETNVSWKTFPERLEENNISWKIYQNEITLPTGFEGEEEPWLANFGDNPIEYFSQYQVKFAPEYYNFIQKYQHILPKEIEAIKVQLNTLKAKSKEHNEASKLLQQKNEYLAIILEDLVKYTSENFEKLSTFDKNIHKKAFVNNRNDSNYHELINLEYDDNGKKRQAEIPKGDVFHQFREDVNSDNLPTVSWLVAPQNFSDHPSSPWYGSWYLSETMDILTKNPEIWKKTIFILCYDENDGYFDHVPPFVAPDPHKSQSGKVSDGIDTAIEQAPVRNKKDKTKIESSSIGLGFRVPLLVASPWSRGGKVCSEVFDHTSILQFLEKFLSHKTKKEIREENITDWRRTVCGDLTSSFTPYNQEKIKLPAFQEKIPFVEGIHKAKFKKIPSNFKQLSAKEIKEINLSTVNKSPISTQEKGIRAACSIPYELYVNGKLSTDNQSFEIEFNVSKKSTNKIAGGAPFVVYALGKFAILDENKKNISYETVKTRNYAVKGGDTLKDSWLISDFENDQFHLQVYGPNGFFQEYKGIKTNSNVVVSYQYETLKGQKNEVTGNILLYLKNNHPNRNVLIELIDNAYKSKTRSLIIKKGKSELLKINTEKSHAWYDFTIKEAGNQAFEQRFAGHVETGKESFTDPLMGGLF